MCVCEVMWVALLLTRLTPVVEQKLEVPTVRDTSSHRLPFVPPNVTVVVVSG